MHLLLYVEYLSKGCENIVEDVSIGVSIVDPDIGNMTATVKVRAMLKVLLEVQIYFPREGNKEVWHYF